MLYARPATGRNAVWQMRKVGGVLIAVSLFASSLAFAANPHPRPRKGQDTDCTDCRNENGPVNGVQQKTVGFDDPLFAYVGRYVDSANTGNIQNTGIRTVRAQRVRVSPARAASSSSMARPSRRSPSLSS